MKGASTNFLVHQAKSLSLLHKRSLRACKKWFLYFESYRATVFNGLKRRSFSGYVLLPLFIYACYMLFWQSPIYESNAKISIENNDSNTTLMLNIGFMGQSGSDDMRNAYLTKSFIESYELLETLDKKHDYLSKVSSQKVDFFSRLSKHSSHQEQLDYFRKHITVSFDQETSELVISLEAFDPHDAKEFLDEIIELTKPFINHISNSLAVKRYEFSRKQLEKYKQKLYLAEVDLIKFQNEHGIFDPQETAREVSMVMAKLKERLIGKQTELLTFSAFMQENSSKIISLKEEINAIKKQLEEQTNTLIGNNHNETLNALLADYQWKELTLKFSSTEFEAAQKAYELASLDLAKQQNVLVVLSVPSYPDEKSQPKVLFNVLIAFCLLSFVYVIVKMAWLIIEEHTD